MKNGVLLIAIICVSLQGFGNAAMPGMWQTGHGGRFIPLFREDSIHFGKIQMQRELVCIDLYSGFAAVKGEYWMYNTTNEPVTIRVGYPVNGKYDQELVDNVMFEDLHSLKVLINDQAVTFKTPKDELDTSFHLATQKMQVGNWYYWNCTFAPKQLTKITVYFLTNNSNTGLRRGYSVDKGNGFAYILETGKAWAGKIEQGQVLIQLKDNLSLKNIKGVYPTNTLVGDDKHLKFSFTNLEPDSSNNILLWYEGKTKDFNFNSINSNAATYFAALDAFPVAAFSSSQFNIINKTDFKPHDSGLTWFFIIVIAVVVVGLIILFFILRWLYRLIFKRRKD